VKSEDKAMVINGGSGLAALEFADCLLDSPEFRENLNRHEKELEKTSQQIKRIIKEIKDLLNAAKSESRCWRCYRRSVHHVMEFFTFYCVVE
jgi:Rho GTPase-activating protein 26